MIGLATLVAAASTLAPPVLPALPERGLVRDTTAGIQLLTMRGRPLATIPRLNIAPDMATSRELLLRDRRGSLYVLDRRARRLREVSVRRRRWGECRVTDRQAQRELIVCKSTIKVRGANGELRIVARAPGKIGHWERAGWAPRGNVFFAQWSAECEVPVAFHVANGVMRPYGARTYREAPSSMALGWLPDGRAVIHFPNGYCGGSQGAPGIYAVPRFGMTKLLVRTPSRADRYWMWGG